MELDGQVYESTLFKEMAERGEILVDTGRPGLQRDVYVQRRQVGDSVVPTSIADPTSTSVTSSSESSTASPGETTSAATGMETKTQEAATTVSTSTTPTVTSVSSKLPSPFDTSIGSNFTVSSCPRFFSSFLNNATFQSCVPVSLLLQNSNSFFRAQRTPTLLTQTLDAACNAPLAICSPLLANIASQLIETSNCGQDFRQQNPLVSQAYAGLIAYEPIYRATCLRDATTANYCFAEAISNSTNPADSYPYYTALGLSLPASAQPSCTSCLKDTMSIFAGYAPNGAQPLAKTYLPCASQVDSTCGPNFVATDVKVGSVSNPNTAAMDTSVPTTSLVLVATVAAMWIGLW